MSESHDAARINSDLGSRWKVSENCYKMHSCCGHTHTAIDVALELREAAISNGAAADAIASSINAVRVDTYGPGFDIVKEMSPRSPYQAMFSMAYVVAAALVEGDVGLGQFAADRFATSGMSNRSIAELLGRTQVAVADDLTAMYPAAWPTRVSVVMNDGRVLRGESSFPRGNPENPVGTAELEEKFVRLVGPRYGDAIAERALAIVRSIIERADMATAFSDIR
jgi:2-methylcitrate dehydratase PrpD